MWRAAVFRIWLNGERSYKAPIGIQYVSFWMYPCGRLSPLCRYMTMTEVQHIDFPVRALLSSALSISSLSHNSATLLLKTANYFLTDRYSTSDTSNIHLISQPFAVIFARYQPVSMMVRLSPS